MIEAVLIVLVLILILDLVKFIWIYEKYTREEQNRVNDEMGKAEREYYKNEIKKTETWRDFIPGETIISTPDKIRKHNPDEITGLFDSVFEPDGKDK